MSQALCDSADAPERKPVLVKSSADKTATAIFSLRSNNPTNSSKLQRWSESQNSPLSKNEKWCQRRFTYERQTPCERARCHLGDKRFRAIRNDRATSSTEGGRGPNDFDRPEIRKTSGEEAPPKSGLLRRRSTAGKSKPC